MQADTGSVQPLHGSFLSAACPTAPKVSLSPFKSEALYVLIGEF